MSSSFFLAVMALLGVSESFRHHQPALARRTRLAATAAEVTPTTSKKLSAKEDLEAAMRAAAEADRRFAEQLMSRPASGEAACADELVSQPQSQQQQQQQAQQSQQQVELMRGPMDSLFTTKLLSVAEERSLGKVAKELLEIETTREALLDERVKEPEQPFQKRRRSYPRAGGRKGVRVSDPVLVERRVTYSRSAEFRVEWARRTNCTCVAELDERVAAGRAARQALVAANMRLVYALAKRHEGHGVGFSDLVQEGAIGLMRAATKFDPDRGYKFSTYAYHWIRQALLRALASDSRLIRLPMYVHDELVRLTRCRSAFLWSHGREPTDVELCDQLELTPEKLRRLDSAVRCAAPVSTDAIVKPEAGSDKAGGGGLGGNGVAGSYGCSSKAALKVFDDASGYSRYVSVDNKRTVAKNFVPSAQPRKSNRDLRVSDTLTDDSGLSSETAVDYSLMTNAIEEALDYLTADEQKVIRQRFGLDDGITRSCTQIAQRFCETKEWVKSVENSALRKLRNPQSRNILQPHQEAYIATLSPC